jgi:hypothetical protein
VVEHHRADEAWTRRREELVALVNLAEHEQGSVPPGFDAVKLKRGERVFDGLPGEMLEERSRDGRPTLVSAGTGTIVITNLRVAFNGAKRREWFFDKLQGKQHQGDDTTLMTVSNRQAVPGCVTPRDGNGLAC